MEGHNGLIIGDRATDARENDCLQYNVFRAWELDRAKKHMVSHLLFDHVDQKKKQ